MENPIKMADLGGKPTIFGNTLIVVEPLLTQTTTLLRTRKPNQAPIAALLDVDAAEAALFVGCRKGGEWRYEDAA